MPAVVTVGGGQPDNALFKASMKHEMGETAGPSHSNDAQADAWLLPTSILTNRTRSLRPTFQQPWQSAREVAGPDLAAVAAPLTAHRNAAQLSHPWMHLPRAISIKCSFVWPSFRVTYL